MGLGQFELLRAEEIRDQFLKDLSIRSGRMPNTEDALTSSIVAKAQAQGIDAVLALQAEDWVGRYWELVQEHCEAIPNYSELHGRLGWRNKDEAARLARRWARSSMGGHVMSPRDPQDLAVCLLYYCFEAPNALVPVEAPATKAAIVAAFQEPWEDSPLVRATLNELQAQKRLGELARALATLFGVGAFVLTKALVILPLVLVSWLMAYMLIDQRAIDAHKTRLALKRGDESE